MQPVETFFRLLFGPRAQGVICIATLTPSKDFEEFYFDYPQQLPQMLEKIQEHAQTRNVYFCPQLLKGRKRSRAGVTLCTNVWADLDECHPDTLLVKPSVTLESSPGRFQGFWILDEPVEPDVAESIARRITYYHADAGSDRTGWDLSQLLRIPFTYNLKYDEPHIVKLLTAKKRLYRVSDFAEYPELDALVERLGIEMPEIPDMSGYEVLSRFVNELPPTVELLFRDVPDGGSWSETLWNLEVTSLEAGLLPEHVYILARDAACNKFARDKKAGAEHLLWQDILRAEAFIRGKLPDKPPEIPEDLPDIISEGEIEFIKDHRTFIQEYIEWAKKLGDAAEQYHQAGALVLLSSLISGSVRLPTSFGTIKPNLWFMILADTTLTRKSTAMDIAMDLLEEVDSSAILATDGSLEGLMGSLSLRPGRPSIFLRDEFSGLLESITKKDYYAGMAETLTKLYDGKMQKRVLKKETVEVKDPTLIVFAGGIRNKVTQLLTTEYISSGFIPRFVFITAESDVDKVRPIGPPTSTDSTGRSRILDVMRKLFNHYHTEESLETMPDGRIIHSSPHKWDAELAPEAWVRYNQLETDMMRTALKMQHPEIMTPVYDRLCKSALKTAVLLAAADQLKVPGQKIRVDLRTLLVAILYMREWRDYGNDVIRDIGVTREEKMFRNALFHVQTNPGRTRSLLMQTLHLNARSTEFILQTLEQRGEIRREKKSGGERIFPVSNKITVRMDS